MRELAHSGEIDHLVPERSWTEFRKAMQAPRPSVFIQVLRDCDALSHLLPEVEALFGVPQNARYHPEIDTGRHTLMALDAAARAGASEDARVAVLLHDLGKGITPQDELPSHRGHETAGLPLVEAVCERFRVPNATRRTALQVCEHHLRCHRLLEARPATIMRLLEGLDAIRQPGINDFLAACEADFHGRSGWEDRPYPQADRLRSALAAARQVKAAELVARGLSGPALGEALRSARIEAISKLPVEPGQQAGHGREQQQ
jgi:tRNA nucleotidyltransferase (CCA-adding enzyme)